MSSPRYHSLKLEIAKLEKKFLPTRLTGPITLRQHDFDRGFRLFAHAEIEAYLEDRSREVSLAATRKFGADRKPHIVVLSLLAFEKVQAELSDKFCKASGDSRKSLILKW